MISTNNLYIILVQISALYKIAAKGIMREITRMKNLFIVLLSFGVVITLTITNTGLSYQETKAQSEKIRIIAVDDAFSDLSRNLTTSTGTDNGTG
jgi:hypothetical protein